MDIQKIKKIGENLIKVGTGGALVLAAGIAGIYFAQNNFLYIPSAPGLPRDSYSNPYGYRSPEEQKINSENIEIVTPDKIILRGWFMKCNKNYEKAPTVVFFHENAGNLGTRLHYFATYMNYTNVNILAIAYRGYSESEGKPSEKGLQQDTLSILKYIEDIDKNLIFTHGRSLGGATSVYGITESQYKIRGAIIENTFTSIDEISQCFFPKVITKFNKIILRNKWETVSRIDKIKCPSLFIKTVQDEIVPANMMQTLYEKATSCEWKKLLQMEQGTHNDNWAQSPKQYFDQINDFFKKCINVEQVQKL